MQKKLVDKHRPSMQIDASRAKTTCLNHVHVPTELPLCTPPLLVGTARSCLTISAAPLHADLLTRDFASTHIEVLLYFPSLFSSLSLSPSPLSPPTPLPNPEFVILVNDDRLRQIFPPLSSPI